MISEDIAAVVAELSRRVTLLEAGARSCAAATEIPHDATLANVPDESRLSYSGAGTYANRPVSWTIVRTANAILTESEATAASVCAALGNPTRVRIISELLDGDLSTAALAERLDQPTAGQLFHHLKELLSAGLIHQPERGTYAVRAKHIVPLLTLLSASIDLHTYRSDVDPA